MTLRLGTWIGFRLKSLIDNNQWPGPTPDKLDITLTVYHECQFFVSAQFQPSLLAQNEAVVAFDSAHDLPVSDSLSQP